MVQNETEVAVTNAFIELFTSQALLSAAQRTLATSQENLRVVRARLENGLASPLDEARAEADVGRAEQLVADVGLRGAVAARQLRNLSGLDVEGPVHLPGIQGEARELSSWTAELAQHPSVVAARQELRAAELLNDAAWSTLLPILAATGTERITNAVGFGPNSQWALALTATWAIDFGRVAAVHSRSSGAAVARIRTERALQNAETRVHDVWHRVRALNARLSAARSAESAAGRAAEYARVRFEAGTATQLDVSQTERDHFSAEATRIEAESSLTAANIELRLRAGLALDSILGDAP